MRIAVIGAGVTGLGAAYALKDACEVVLYEKDRRLGGHAHTIDVEGPDGPIAVDAGFIVYNAPNYPNLVGLLDALSVDSFETDMSFSFSNSRLEWSSNFPRGIFAQKRNLASPRFLGMLADIRRFNRVAAQDLDTGRLNGLLLGEYLGVRGFGAAFERHYLSPMGAAIWSTTAMDILKMPAETFGRFFANHGLLELVPPLWRTVKGGSVAYVEALRALLGPRVRAGTGVARVRRDGDGVEVIDLGGAVDRFDQVLFACHSDQALAMLSDADAEERALLAAIRYAPNQVYLHRDRALMPARRAAWASWNYLAGAEAEPGGVTYWMNNLQAIDSPFPLFVSLNPPRPPAPELTFEQFGCDHPQFDADALAAQERFNRIQGRRGVWYAGAWLGYGFHEDGLTAGLRVARALGGATPWRFVDHRIKGGPLPSPAAASRSDRERVAA